LIEVGARAFFGFLQELVTLSPLPPKPPAVKKDGTVVAEGEEPPKEKSFLAKYWYCECDWVR
jgi:hypothetical protein